MKNNNNEDGCLNTIQTKFICKNSHYLHIFFVYAFKFDFDLYIFAKLSKQV